MKVSFFAAALLGLVAVQAVELPQEYDLADYTLAEIDSNTEGDTHAEGEAEGEVHAKTEADCEQVVGGVTIRLNTPECAGEAPVPFENQMLTALQELSGKSMDLYEALKVQFAKNARLAAGKTMKVDGLVTIKPKVDEEPPIVIPPSCPPEIKMPQSIKIGVDSDAKPADK